jgi:hypothetical protein
MSYTLAMRPPSQTLARLLPLLLLSALLLGACGARSGRRGAATSAADASPVADASAPRADGPPLDPVERVLRACAVAASCSTAQAGSQASFSASACVDWFGRSFVTSGYAPSSTILRERLLDCAGKGADCKGFHRCFGGDLVSAALCHEGATCQGSQVRDNVGPLASGASFDCASLGVSWGCIDLPTGAARACCVRDVSGAPCVPRCESDTLGVQCLFGATIPVDCGGAGLTCDTTVDTLCRGRDATCPADTPARCAGARATRCVGGRLQTIDCAQNPFRSGCGASNFEPCVASGSSCTSSSKDSCAGDRLQLCVDGRRASVDCKALGFEICFGPLGGRPARCGFLL